MTQIKNKCHVKKHVLVNVKVEADLSGMIWGRPWQRSPEELGKELDRATKEFHNFLRDHRSQDMISLDVIREYADICSACGDKWEADEDDQGVYCACCGACLETEAERERNEQTQDADY